MKKRILLLIPPVLLVAAFLFLRYNSEAMETAHIVTSLWRRALGLLTSFLPFSLMEIGGTALVLAASALLVLLIVSLIRRSGQAAAARRLMTFVVVLFYGGAIALWTICTVYYVPPVYSGVLERQAVSAEELRIAAEFFRDGANALAERMPRDENGSFNMEIDRMLDLSGGVYDGLTDDFPALGKSSVMPKKMLYSRLMSRTGFTGIYLGLTGEANINRNSPRVFIPVTITHELAHSRGVGAEDAANFFGIAACITSGIPEYEYSGYLSGLVHIQNALSVADFTACIEVHEGYSDTVRRDLQDNSKFWEEIREENAESPAMEAVAAMVTESYDLYLRTNEQESGMATYGECVDILIAWLRYEKNLF